MWGRPAAKKCIFDIGSHVNVHVLVPLNIGFYVDLKGGGGCFWIRRSDTWDSYVGNSNCSELHGIPMWGTVIVRNHMGFLCGKQ